MKISTSKLRCKPGDLAIVIKSRDNMGRIVRVVEMFEPQTSRWLVEAFGSPLTVEKNGVSFKAYHGLSPDSCLAPLPRDQDGDAKQARRSKTKPKTREVA